VFAFDGEVYAVLHLMVAGRLKWKPSGAKIPAKIGLAAFTFENGVLLLTEAGTKRRASLSLTRGRDGLSAYDPGGVEPFVCDVEEFHAALTRENHTLKRALTDQHLVSGIGNAYSDEILHAARMSPFTMTRNVDQTTSARLLSVTRAVLSQWRDRLTPKRAGSFPSKVTAFHPEMAVHGKFGDPCPVCGTLVQRIRYADNESNYCPGCQTGGQIYSDRALARLLKDEWPKTVEELTELERRNAARSEER
jgi:formamidopyrimidine-DNA glycosylase